ncbi:MAG: nucleoside-diphosphate kinase [Candidatus Hermodarchaeota archaeon]
MNSQNPLSLSRTLILIKPDGVQRGLVGEILARFERVGLKIIGMKLVQINAEFSKKHYREHIKKNFYPALEKFIIESPVVALVLEGIDAIQIARKIVGTTEPKSAQPGTIRGDFTHQSYEYTITKGIIIKNLVHASANESDAKFEVALWFSDKELFSYSTVHDKHIF